jgi:hypothetical protein
MQIELVPQPDAVIARWQELVDDPELARWPGRVETDRLGRIIVSLIPALSHSFRQGDIFRALATSCLVKLSSHAACHA